MPRKRKRKSAGRSDWPPLPGPSVAYGAGYGGGQERGKKPKPRKPKPGTSPYITFDPIAPGTDPRDLAALINYGGQSKIPYVNAWTDSRIEQVRNFKNWVFIAIDAVCKRVADQIPNLSWVHTGGNKAKDDRPSAKRLLSSFQRSKALLPLLSHEQLEAVPHNHPLLRLLKKPNNQDTAYDLFYETVMFLLLTGSSYWWMPRNRLGLPVAIFCIPSHWMWPVMGEERWVDAWEVRPVEGNYLRKYIDADDVIQIRFKSPISKVDGFAPLTAINRWADIDESMNRAKWHAYRQGTFPTVSVMFDGKLHDPSDDDLRRIEAKFYSRHVGEIRSNRPLFLPPGVKVVPLSIAPNQMVFGETAQEMRDNILAGFGVPSAAINANVASQGNALQAMSGFFSNTINPLCKMLGQVITEHLATRYDETLRVWWEDRSPDDPELIEKRIQTDLMAASVSPDEIRMMRGREPWGEEWSRRPIFPVNMQFGTMPMGGSHSTAPSTSLNDKMPAPETTDSKKTLGERPHIFDFLHPNTNGH